MVDNQWRLRMIVRTTRLLRWALEANGNRYDGSLVPNLTSITDLATMDAGDLDVASIEASIDKLEHERGMA